MRPLVPMTDTVVECPTEHSKAFGAALAKNGFTWFPKTSPAHWMPAALGVSGCDGRLYININDFIIYHSSREHYESQSPKYQIIHVSEFIDLSTTNASCPDCNGSKVYRGLTVEEPCKTCCIPGG